MATTKTFQLHEEPSDTPDFSPKIILEQLRRLLGSPEFHATEAQRALLQYVIEKFIAGKVTEIKGYTIATRVFGRREDFDQARDPIVSIQANKLRRALERYYLVEGYCDPVIITIPKGAYVPVFKSRQTLSPAGNVSERKSSAAANGWPVITVRSLENQTLEKDLDYLGVGIATEIAQEITRYQEVRVLRHIDGCELNPVTEANARFVLGGNIKKSHNGLKVMVSLTNQATGMQIWADSYQTGFNLDDLVTFEEKIARAIVGKIFCEHGIISKTLSCESERIPPANLETHQAILHFYQFAVNFSAKTFMETYQALERACLSEPGCGLIWSIRARLYSINYSLELFDVHTPIEEAVSFAQKGVQLEPANQRVRLINAYVLFLKNELSAGMNELEAAFNLNPEALISQDIIGYLMTLFGDWQRGPALMKKAIGNNPYYNTTVHHALWLDWVRQEQYDRAYEETHHFSRPTLFWDPLLKAVTYGLLGRHEIGKQASRQLLSCKPEFTRRGRTLIQHYIKHEDLAEKIISSLKKVGVDLK